MSLNEAGSVLFNRVASQNPGAPLTASVIAQPTHGAIAINADGTWTYTPGVPFYGADRFYYQAKDLYVTRMGPMLEDEPKVNFALLCGASEMRFHTNEVSARESASTPKSE